VSESDRCGSPFLRLIRGVTVGKLTARLSVCRTKRLNDELTLACGVFAELLRCVACVNCGVTAYINSKLCVLKRVESISESPGSVRQTSRGLDATVCSTANICSMQQTVWQNVSIQAL